MLLLNKQPWVVVHPTMGHPVGTIANGLAKRMEDTGIYSCCSANEDVIRAALLRARKTGTPALIESTSNQVNQLGGDTGMTPFDFADFVRRLAEENAVSSIACVLHWAT